MKTRFIQTLLLSLAILLSACGHREKITFTEGDISIIPKPRELKLNEGAFVFNEKTVFLVEEENQEEIARTLTDKFKAAAGWEPQIVTSAPDGNFVEFRTDAGLEDEAYELHSTGNAITISANGYSGFLYGVETLRQLLPDEIEGKDLQRDITWAVPATEIKDSPRFPWRGLMLDVSRHFFPKEYVLKVIDGLAMHKMNVLHLHLVDDQGWRIEIKKYPKLTEVGGYRVDKEDMHWNARPAPKPSEKATYGGFYTQEDIKEIVAYAHERGIEVVPEIEMPAHVMSAIAAYPELSCKAEPVMVPSGGVWPITDIYCAGKESTFEFLENVLTEVMELFPSKYIHVGGDEATKTNWKSCPHCQKRIREEGLADVKELQSYFIKRMERFISSKGRTLIGWDEILEGGLAPGATVMSWRGIQGGWEASEQGHDVVMTPGTHCYFDHYQGPQDSEPTAFGGYTPLSKVYEFDPVVDSMSVTQAKHVLGGQANLWAEYVPTTSHSEYMIYPRLAALAEAVWSPKEGRDWKEFVPRMEHMFERYDKLGINYAKSAYTIMADTKVDEKTHKVTLALKNEIPGSDIRYVLNGEDLTSAKKYSGPIEVAETTTVKASLFKDDKPVGKEFKKTFTWHKAVGKKVAYKNPWNKNYPGTGTYSMVNVLRGTKNFHDGQWQGWLHKDMELTIDLEESAGVRKVTIGTLENQGSGIYFPAKVEVLLSNEGKTFKKVGEIKRDYAVNGDAELKDFTVTFPEETARYVKVKAARLGNSPKGGDTWLFVDEVVVE
ncbi:beta-N-acetylhexosaminidase [Sinomicrobium weinanense]|uniref:beta-N-acetylhexosaminidase n=1 Tax=Sinomicrobium weinanense TaxID=2842200 RepID=A0A926Q2K3_9FLAO|nr:glycoside hydrolase family 20 protein [Sinomicrobium weinanense]MBC9795939.1 family 20 glycosylhydrolase [Sinomicrobium weinanense]MBU3124682.1 family 20 glycosylhydrolase [Sinomicrobium weinanense]